MAWIYLEQDTENVAIGPDLGILESQVGRTGRGLSGVCERAYWEL